MSLIGPIQKPMSKSPRKGSIRLGNESASKTLGTMKKTTCKRRRLQKPEPVTDSHSNGPRAKSIRTVNGFNCSTSDPYPAHSSPSSNECLSVRDDLLNLHGFPREFVKYRKERERLSECCSVVDGGGGEPPENVEPEPVDEKESVLDGLVRTVLSQNTTEANSERAFASLKSAFATWEDVSLLLSLNGF